MSRNLLKVVGKVQNFYHDFVMFCRVVQLVEALCYKLEDHGFDSWWDHWDVSLT
jgi:hypothetical protein